MALSQTPEAERIIAEAQEQEREHNWPGAIDSYKRVLDLVLGQEDVKRAETIERLGYALYRAARQAETAEEFKARIGQSMMRYEEAHDLCEKLNSVGRKLRCDSMIARLGFWLASEPAERKKLLAEAWKLTRQASAAFEQAGEAQEYGKTYNETPYNGFASSLEWDLEARRNLFRETVETGEQAIRLLTSLGDRHELSRAYFITATYLEWSTSLIDLDQRAKITEKVRAYWKKAETLLGGLDYEVEFFSAPSAVYAPGSDEALGFLENALEYRRKIGDKLLVANALDTLAWTTLYRSLGIEDPDDRIKLAMRALEYAEDARRHYTIFSFISNRPGFAWVGAPRADVCWYLALWETDLDKKRDLLEEAREAAEEGLVLANNSGYHVVVAFEHGYYGRILGSQAGIERDPETKRRLLEQALEHHNESITMIAQLYPFAYWNQGFGYNYLADAKAELAELARDTETKRKMLQEAILTKETSLKLCRKDAVFNEEQDRILVPSRLGGWQYEQGSLLDRLYALTGNREDLAKAAEAFLIATDSFRKSNNSSRMAECYWRAAQAFDALGDHLQAEEKFTLASNNYKTSADKIPRLKDFYLDHASYMEAWSEIEKAKHHHERQDYGSAKEFYERAASLHKSTREWSFLTPNYSALAQLENGEDLSRKEGGQEAIQAFDQANRLFNETRTMLQAELSKIENVDKKQMVASLVKGAELRRDYCMGRIALEEAKLLDRKGDYSSSSQKYGQAAETFEKVTRNLDIEQVRMEVKLIATVSRAWQMMVKAEAEASPELFMEASKLFEEVRELSPNEKAKSLALGHSRFCRALDAGTRFADSGDPSMHTAAIQHLESASKYYLKAGFQDASEYAEATELLFDAYLHMDEAKKEKDHERKTKLYAMTEKVLQASAESFLKAQHPAKSQEALRLLEKVKRERELTMSLAEVLHAPAFVSATTAFSAPTPARERPVGLERFEYADVQASLITRQKSLKVGDDLNLEIELVNAGKGPAQLVKVEELIPEGFELTGKPEPYRVEDSYLNMKGRRLDPLKTEEVKLVLRPKVQGQFTLKPRILYLDESGKYKSHEPEPVEVTVKELGISGWLKGR